MGEGTIARRGLVNYLRKDMSESKNERYEQETRKEKIRRQERKDRVKR